MLGTAQGIEGWTRQTRSPFIGWHQGCCSVAQSYPTLCGPMDCSMPGLPVLHHLLEFAQVHVHYISDAVQPSHPLTPSFSALNLSQHQGFSSESSVHIRWPKYWSFSLSISPSSEYSGWSPLRLTGLIFLLSNGLSGVFFSTVVWRH